jgi:hypothetical protein
MTHQTRSRVLLPRASTPARKTRRVGRQPRAPGRARTARTDLCRRVAQGAVAFDVAAHARGKAALGLPRVVLPRSYRSRPDRGRGVEAPLPGQRRDGRALRDACALVARHTERLSPVATVAPGSLCACGNGMGVEPVAGVKGTRTRAAVVAVGTRAVVVATGACCTVRPRRLAMTHYPAGDVSQGVRPLRPSRHGRGPRRRRGVQPGCRAGCEKPGESSGGERPNSFHWTLTCSVPSKRIRSPESRFMLCSHSTPSRVVSRGDTPPPSTYVRLAAPRSLRSSSSHE